MMFKIVSYLVDDGLPRKVPERTSLVEAESFDEALDLAKRVLGTENREDVTLTQFVGQVPRGAKVYARHMTFEEMYGLEPGGLATAL